ncbi:ribosome small subunit-dependent GTPase A [Lacticaseibacillus absianus]|uniref:ribosome small subunit-dependent GTPase A n=1 Tax=Lacticaseibacillus absianus TaxID=2729623 RepID=UPI0015CA4B92|nr:ribosome small subunit-dependent GTPase A [Lacticaseibacillus absianus]
MTESEDRLMFQGQDQYQVQHDHRLYPATLRGKLRHHLHQTHATLVVGDRVGGQLTPDGTYLIDTLLPRTTFLARDSGRYTTQQQGIAANLTHIVIVTSANHDFNLNRLRRFHTLAVASGAQPVFLISKTDLVSADVRADLQAQVHAVFADAPIVTTDRSQAPATRLAPLLTPTAVLAFIGSSGVGKSTLLAALVGRSLQTATIREDDSHGRHATASRQAFALPNGALVIDTPGLRAVGLDTAATGLTDQFAPILALAAQCKFRNCQHAGEPGCAVAAALEAGTLDTSTWTAYQRFAATLATASQREARAQRQARQAAGRRAVRSEGRRRNG